jgi:hypothetical protein
MVWRKAMVWRKGTTALGLCAGLSLAACGLAFSVFPAPAQAPIHQRPLRPRLLPSNFPPQPTVAPAWSIPVDPLGFSPPGPLYLGARNSLASLDFIGEDKLLFTFRVPGLLHRDPANSNASDERQIRAVVLDLPQGTVEAETVWTLHDRTRYLWMLNDGHFLLRDRNNLMVGDSSLTLKPFLQFPGPLLSVSLDPTQRYIVTNSHEPARTTTAKPGQVPSPSTASATMTANQTTRSQGATSQSTGSQSTGSQGTGSQSTGSQGTADQGTASQGDPSDPTDADASPDTVVRILRRDSGNVMLVSRTRSTVELPINADGYVEDLRGQGWNWALNLTFFEGGTKMLGSVESHCDPTEEFISQKEFLVTACATDGTETIVAMTTAGRSLWADQTPTVAIWPQVAMAPGGQRIARETLGVTHPVNAYAPIDPDDIKGQWVTVYEAATGDVALETPASPALDSGGNVAISPSGRRVAVLNAGAIQVFELPAPPPLAESAGQ